MKIENISISLFKNFLFYINNPFVKSFNFRNKSLTTREVYLKKMRAKKCGGDKETCLGIENVRHSCLDGEKKNTGALHSWDGRFSSFTVEIFFQR